MWPASSQIAAAPARGAYDIDIVTRVLHLALAVFGVAAWLSGDLSDYEEGSASLGFILHSWLGIAASSALGLRIVWGVIGPSGARFSSWVPVTRERWRLVLEDLGWLLRLRIPERPAHQGLAGVVQSFGLIVFAWSAVTGSVLFFSLEPGVRPGAWLDLLKELHEAGETLIPAFLAIHVAATVVHALAGDVRWRRMLFLSSEQTPRRPMP